MLGATGGSHKGGRSSAVNHMVARGWRVNEHPFATFLNSTGCLEEELLYGGPEPRSSLCLNFFYLSSRRRELHPPTCGAVAHQPTTRRFI
jgi:hypothetical protein